VRGNLPGAKFPLVSVISRLSILENPAVGQDLIAYLALIDKPYDDIAAARVLAPAAGSLRRLVRFADTVPSKNRQEILWTN